MEIFMNYKDNEIAKLAVNQAKCKLANTLTRNGYKTRANDIKATSVRISADNMYSFVRLHLGEMTLTCKNLINGCAGSEEFGTETAFGFTAIHEIDLLNRFKAGRVNVA